MSVSAIIVTRGDVDLDDVVAPIPEEWESLIWDNGRKEIRRRLEGTLGYVVDKVEDLSVYGRYAAIEYATHDLIYVQDDDVLHTTEGVQEIVNAWLQGANFSIEGPPRTVTFDPVGVAANEVVVCNMPVNFRARHFYDEHSLVGFGACFHRGAPERAFGKFAQQFDSPEEMVDWIAENQDWYHRTCDIVFTALTPRVLVDVPYDDMPWASAENRMWKQPTHQADRDKMLDLVLKVRDNH